MSWSRCLRAAGLTYPVLDGAGLGPVNLEANVRFLRELRDGEDVAVTCAFEWGEGKTFRVRQEFTRGGGCRIRPGGCARWPPLPASWASRARSLRLPRLGPV